MVATIFTGCGGGTQPTPTPPGGDPGDPPVDNRVFEINFAHFFPASHRIEVDVAQVWGRMLEEASNGRIRVNTFPAETLLRNVEMYEGIVQGVADVGLSVYASTRGRFPVLETMLLPGVSFINSESASWAVMEAIEVLDPVELHDVHHLWTWGTGPADLFSTRKISTMEDLRGLQIGATAGPRADGLAVLGATPVILPMSEWYEALARGVMDGGLAPMETWFGFRLGEVSADHVTLTPFLYNQLFFTVMNLDTWNSFPADLQQIITATTAEFYRGTMPTLWNEINEGGYRHVKETKGVEVTILSPEEEARWRALLPPIHEEYVEFLYERGLPGSEILQTMKDLADKYNALYPDFAPYVYDLAELLEDR
jgi:TRAP-type C4-dicarboxylate transport system substrate-binding protein